jgi:hypothetical protein
MENVIQEFSTALSATKSSPVTKVTDSSGLELKGERKVIFIRTNVKDFGGIKEIIDANTLKITGITNLENKDMLPNGKTWLCTGLRLVAAPETDTLPKSANYATENVLPALANGETKILQDGILQTISTREIVINPEVDKRIPRGKQFFKVTPFRVGSGSVFQLTQEFVSAVAVDHCVEFALEIFEISASAQTGSNANRSC